jgi:tRNA A37 threonylcarbamoyladenosine synthetase subunit TsaC/SUA5/YrdC
MDGMDFTLLDAVASLEKPDGLIAVPEYSSYMLTCRIDRPEALARMARIRKSTLPLAWILLGRDFNALQPYVERVQNPTESIMCQHWPGALAIRLSTSVQGRDALPLHSDTLTVMQPDVPLLLDLLSLIPGGILVALEAARGTESPAETMLEVYNAFGDDVDYVLMAEEMPDASRPATLIEFSENGEMRILRSGRVVLD